MRTETDAGGGDVLSPLAGWLSERTGLDLSGSRGRWLRDVLSAAGRLDDGWLQRLVDNEPGLLDELCTAATVQESYFFREPSTLAFLREEVLPSLAERPGPVTVWTAGCAGGEETYTLGFMLADAGVGGRGVVLGTDLVSEAVHRAREGVYGSWSLRGLDGVGTDSLFRRDSDRHDRFTVNRQRSARVDFVQHNLLDGPPDGAPFDLVLCRNVLIYLTPEAVRRVGEVLVQALSPGGWLVLGVSDPALQLEGLERVPRPAGGVVYRRGVSAAPVVPAESTVRRGRGAQRPGRRTTTPRADVRERPGSAAPRAARTHPPQAWADEAERALLLAQPERASTLARAALAEGSDRRRAHEVLIRALDAENRQDDALVAASRAVQEFPLAAELRGLMAVVELQAGRLEDAHDSARRALYLDPQLALPNLVLARAADLLGDRQTARRARRNAHRLLVRSDQR